MSKFENWLVLWAERVAVFCFGSIMVLYVIETVGIPVFGYPVMWTREISRYAALAATFIACGPLVYRGRHIAIEILPTSLKGLPLTINTLLINLVVLAVAVLVIYYGCGITVRTYQMGYTYPVEVKLPVWITFATAPLGMLMTVLITSLMLIENVRSICRRHY